MEEFILLIYIICACIDSYASEHHKSRICKVLLVPLLVILMVLHGCRDIFIFFALAFCWFGDLLLIRKTDRRKLFGMLSFLAGHVCYCIFFLARLKRISLLALIPYICTCIVYLNYNYKLIRKDVLIPCVFYLIVINCMSWLSFCTLLGLQETGTFLTWTGTVFFLISDTLISRQIFLKKEQRGVMETYSLAQLLIVTGVLYGI